MDATDLRKAKIEAMARAAFQASSPAAQADPRLWDEAPAPMKNHWRRSVAKRPVLRLVPSRESASE